MMLEVNSLDRASVSNSEDEGMKMLSTFCLGRTFEGRETALFK